VFEILKIGIFLINPLNEGLGFSHRPYMLIKYLSLHKDVELHVFTPHNEEVGKSQRVYFHRLGSNKFSENLYMIVRYLIKKRVFTSNFIYRPITLNVIIQRLAHSLREQLVKNPVDILQAEQDVPSAAAILAKHFTEVPVAADIHDLWAYEEIMCGRVDYGSSSYEAINSIIQNIMKESDLILVGNELLKEVLRSRYGSKHSKLFISPNGGEIFRFNLAKRRKRIIYAGNFEKYENVDLLIEAVKYILEKDRTVEVSIFGKGPEEGNLRRLAKKLSLPNSIFGGFIQRKKLIPFLAESWVGAVPTRKKYATPIKPFEYLSVGLPVVSIKGMWWSNIIEENNAGKTSVFDPKAFAEAILELLNSSDIDLLSKNALNIVRKKYNWYKITEELKTKYIELVS